MNRCWNVTLPDGTPYRVHADTKPSPETAFAAKEAIESAKASGEPREIRRNWAGARKIAHYCRRPISKEHFHEFWIPQVIVDGEKVAVGERPDGDDHRKGCSVDLARFTTHDGAQAFARKWLRETHDYPHERGARTE